MQLPSGTEPVATGVIATLLIVWSKIRFVGKGDFDNHKTACEDRLCKKMDAITHTQEKIFDKMDTFTEEMGAVKQFMKMKGG